MSLALVALLVPYAVVLGYLTTDPVFSYAVNLYLFDIPLVLLVVVTLPEITARLRSRRLGLGAALWLALLALLILSFAIHPSIQGIQTVWRVCGALAIAVAFAGLGQRERTVIVTTLAVGALTQTAWAIAQVWSGGPLGADFLFESQKPLALAGDALVAKGTMQTPYLLAALALASGLLVARRLSASSRPLVWAALLAAVVVPVGLTYSRGALAGVGGAIAALLPRASTGAARRLIIAAILVGIGVPSALTLSGWSARGEQLGEERADSGRGILLLQGLAVLAMDPLAGVGPGRYLSAARTLSDDPGVRSKLLPTHNVPLLVAAENGVLAGAVTVVLLAALVARASRDRDDLALALYLAMLPFWLLDPLPYSLPQGLVLTGLWLGGLDAAHAEVSAAGAPPSRTGPP